MKGVTVALFLNLLSLGVSAPLSDCESLVKPIPISNEDMLGKWLFISGSSELPGTRSLGHLLTSVWVNITPTSQSNILTLVQTQGIYDHCSSLVYNVTFENSTMLIEQPFYLKQVYLKTDCSDCLAVYEKISSGEDTFTSFMLFSKRKSVSEPVLEMFNQQAKCLEMSSPIKVDTTHEICPDNITPSEGLSAMNSLLEAKIIQRVAKLLDTLFDIFVN